MTLDIIGLDYEQLEKLVEGDELPMESVFDFDTATPLVFNVEVTEKALRNNQEPVLIVSGSMTYYGVYFGSGEFRATKTKGVNWWAPTGGTLNGTKKPTMECILEGKE